MGYLSEPLCRAPTISVMWRLHIPPLLTRSCLGQGPGLPACGLGVPHQSFSLQAAALATWSPAQRARCLALPVWKTLRAGLISLQGADGSPARPWSCLLMDKGDITEVGNSMKCPHSPSPPAMAHLELFPHVVQFLGNRGKVWLQ